MNYLDKAKLVLNIRIRTQKSAHLQNKVTHYTDALTETGSKFGESFLAPLALLLRSFSGSSKRQKVPLETS